MVDETEFNFFNNILGDKYSDNEIEMYTAAYMNRIRGIMVNSFKLGK